MIHSMFTYVLNEFSPSIKESPYTVNVVDTSATLVPSDALKMASLTKGIEFTVENKSNSINECEVYATSKYTFKTLFDPKIFKLTILLSSFCSSSSNYR